jgi:hypothetical protein
MARHIGIRIAAALLFVCTVMNLTFFIEILSELWTVGHQYSRQLPKQIVCVLIPRDGDSVLESVDRSGGFVFGGNESIVQSLLLSIAVKDCTFYFVVNNSSVYFSSYGWVSALEHVLQRFNHSDTTHSSFFSRARLYTIKFLTLDIERIRSLWKVRQF